MCRVQVLLSQLSDLLHKREKVHLQVYLHDRRPHQQQQRHQQQHLLHLHPQHQHQQQQQQQHLLHLYPQRQQQHPPPTTTITKIFLGRRVRRPVIVLKVWSVRRRSVPVQSEPCEYLVSRGVCDCGYDDLAGPIVTGIFIGSIIIVFWGAAIRLAFVRHMEHRNKVSQLQQQRTGRRISTLGSTYGTDLLYNTNNNNNNNNASVHPRSHSLGEAHTPELYMAPVSPTVPSLRVYADTLAPPPPPPYDNVTGGSYNNINNYNYNHNPNDPVNFSMKELPEDYYYSSSTSRSKPPLRSPPSNPPPPPNPPPFPPPPPQKKEGTREVRASCPSSAPQERRKTPLDSLLHHSPQHHHSARF
ncbi:hypothetical protein Pmani_008702 [Petrolisthes manimaculis]|uniref:Uncharacterized protein n=1 Tax=Petrolisthes manimaculis TaxID=1843537 RepID=A0AAE1Q619_9EUCA|nr:hypothetical protein Pmani_008702 [Petrolisthes manimaculis]